MGIVLPDSILGSPGLGYIREWLIRNTIIIASVDLHVDTFQPHNGTQTSILILQKKTPAQIQKERETGILSDYNIFMALVDKVGHDKRGNPIFKRNDDGEELLVAEHGVAYSAENQDADDLITTQYFQKEIDDQTLEVPRFFTEWKKNEGIPW